MKENIQLKDHCNYKIGGPAAYFAEAKNIGELKEAVTLAKNKGLPFFVLGGGTNILVSDKGFGGFVIRPAFMLLKTGSELVHAGAGVKMDDLLAFTAAKGLSGLEWAGGLPGTVGGAVRGNAGAFGGEIKDAIETVESFDTKKMRTMTRHRSECYFGYRSSVFKEKRGSEIVTGATFRLKKGDPEKIKDAIFEKINYRKARHPLDYPNVGSVFKNVALEKVPKKFRAVLARVVKNDPFPVVPTAYLISEAGLKGVARGGAMVSPKHPNFIVNVFEAKAADVLSLITLVKTEVMKKFKVKLEEEVQVL